jgi:hypothetical protein
MARIIDAIALHFPNASFNDLLSDSLSNSLAPITLLLFDLLLVAWLQQRME